MPSAEIHTQIASGLSARNGAAARARASSPTARSATSTATTTVDPISAVTRPLSSEPPSPTRSSTV